jgi:hypothetical protein
LNKKSILFFSCEPGGAESLIPAIRLARQQPRFEVSVMAYGHGLDRFRKKQIDCMEIEPIAADDFSIMESCAPNLLITSATSLPAIDMTEKYLWRQARARRIPSLAFVDQWQNYAIRFSGKGADERLAYLPDWINCIDEIGRTEMVREGFRQESLVAFGHPYLSSLKQDMAALRTDELKKRAGIAGGCEVALFVSEPIREYYQNQRGYDQYQVLEYFLSGLTGVPQPPDIVIKLHPKDDRALFQKLADKHVALSPKFVGGEMSALECLAISDFVYGMTSIMLVEAYVLGKPVISLQPGLAVKDPLVLSRHRMIPVVTTYEQRDLQRFEQIEQGKLGIEFEADRFLQFLDRTLH